MTTLDLGSSIPGDVAEVVRIDGADALAQRLEASGFWPGTEVATVRCAPFGGPIEFRLRGFRIALRRSEAQRVIVRPSNVRQLVPQAALDQPPVDPRSAKETAAKEASSASPLQPAFENR